MPPFSPELGGSFLSGKLDYAGSSTGLLAQGQGDAG